MTFATIAYGMLGMIIGAIFVVDGWRAPNTGSTSLRESPKIRGLLYVLGFTTIPAFQVFQNASSNALITYVVALASTIIIGLLLLLLYAFIVSWARLREFEPAAPLWKTVIEAFHAATLILQDGIARFRERSDERLADYHRQLVTAEVDRLILQRDRSILYVVGAFDALATAARAKAKRNMLRGQPVTRRTPRISTEKTEIFIHFIRSILDQCLRECLEEVVTLQHYRASIYYLDAEQQQLRFIAGVGPVDWPHSEQPLDSVDSLAAHAIANPGTPFYWSADPEAQSGEAALFERRATAERYRSVATYAPPLHLQRKISPGLAFHFAISIDCENQSVTTDGQYIAKMFHVLSVLLIDGFDLLGIQQEHMEHWLQSKPSAILTRPQVQADNESASTNESAG